VVFSLAIVSALGQVDSNSETNFIPNPIPAFHGATPLPTPDSPVAPTWDSIRENYQVPEWFKEAKFGIFIHWGLYAVPAYHNEWYAKHMYGEFAQYHTEHYGPPDVFGYKDFIPLFKAEKYDPEAWAKLFKDSGAKYVIPVAEHHDGFAMYDSDLTEWCAGKMGPKRDLIGDLAKAVRKQGLIFGLSSHRMEHHTFMFPTAHVKTDLFDPRYAGFYGPPIPGNMNDGNAPPAFQDDWLARCQELVDKYHPQMFWFDNGVNARAYDGVKLKLAAYYYDAASQWHEPVTIATKDSAYLAGSVEDFEKAVREPTNILDAPWQVDDQIAGNSWGYVNPMRYRSTASIIYELADTVSKDGNLLLNISPRADGTIPDEQQKILLGIGQWLKINGEAIYGTHPWKQFGEGGNHGFRFTVKDNSLYAIALSWPGKRLVITSLSTTKAGGKITDVSLLGYPGKLQFSQDASGLTIQLPLEKPCDDAWAFKVTGQHLP
jgi:alpha-L-fucosidase